MSSKKGVRAGGASGGAAEPGPATEQGSNTPRRAVVRGRDWAIIEHEYKGRKFYDIRTYESERGLVEKLAEAFEAAVDKHLNENRSITYTRWFADKYVKVALINRNLIIQIPEFISYRRIAGFLKAVENVARHLYGQDIAEEVHEEDVQEV